MSVRSRAFRYVSDFRFHEHEISNAFPGGGTQYILGTGDVLFHHFGIDVGILFVILVWVSNFLNMV